MALTLPDFYFEKSQVKWLSEQVWAKLASRRRWKSLKDVGRLLHTVASSGRRWKSLENSWRFGFWQSVAVSGRQWKGQVDSGICSGILLHTVVFFGGQWQALASSRCLWQTVKVFLTVCIQFLSLFYSESFGWQWHSLAKNRFPLLTIAASGRYFKQTVKVSCRQDKTLAESGSLGQIEIVSCRQKEYFQVSGSLWQTGQALTDSRCLLHTFKVLFHLLNSFLIPSFF